MTRKRVALALLIAGAALLLWAFLPSKDEPRYEGRKLSEWLADYDANPRTGTAATFAVRQIGTNALPCLVDWISYRIPARTPKFRSILMRIGGKRILPYVEPGVIRSTLAQRGFEILGPEAAPAIPALTNRLNWEWSSIGATESIFIAFNYMGNTGLAPLISVATNEAVPEVLRRMALVRIRSPLMNVDTNANWVVPLLGGLLKDPAAADQAAADLGDLRLDAPVTVPILIACLQDKGALCPANAAESLGHFGKDAASATPALAEALGSNDFYVRRAETNALEIIAPEVLKKDGH